MSKFSDWLADAMYSHGGRKYGGASLARDLAVSRSTISNWLLERDIPRRDHIHRLAIHFGTTSRYIYGLLDLDPPEDLNDLLEEVNAMVYRLNPEQQKKLLNDLRGKYGRKA